MHKDVPSGIAWKSLNYKPLKSLGQVSANFFCKGPESKYFSLCRLYSLCHNFFLKNKFIYFIYLFLAALGLRCCCGLSLVAESGVCSSLRCAGFSLQWLLLLRSTTLGPQASVVVARGLSSCGARASLLCGMWDPPGLGLESMSPALAGGFFLEIFSFLKYLFIYLFMAALGLRCCTRAFSSCGAGATLPCGARDSHCGGFSCLRALALGVRPQ